MRLWYGTPASLAMPLKYSTPSSESRIVTGFFSFAAHGSLRDLSLARSYSAFRVYFPRKHVFTAGTMSTRIRGVHLPRMRHHLQRRTNRRAHSKAECEMVEGSTESQTATDGAVEQHATADAKLDVAVSTDVARVVRRVVDPSLVHGVTRGHIAARMQETPYHARSAQAAIPADTRTLPTRAGHPVSPHVLGRPPAAASDSTTESLPHT